MPCEVLVIPREMASMSFAANTLRHRHPAKRIASILIRRDMRTFLCHRTAH